MPAPNALTNYCGKGASSSLLVGLKETGRQESELLPDDNEPDWLSEIPARPLPANVKGGLSITCTRLVQQFLNDNFSRKLSIAEMAAVCRLSPYHFVRAFSKTFGVSPHQYVLNLRLDFAGKLLAQRGMSITDIADRSGFSSQSHLTSTMKKHRNATPQQVRMGSFGTGPHLT